MVGIVSPIEEVGFGLFVVWWNVRPGAEVAVLRRGARDEAAGPPLRSRDGVGRGAVSVDGCPWAGSSGSADASMYHCSMTISSRVFLRGGGMISWIGARVWFCSSMVISSTGSSGVAGALGRFSEAIWRP